jgi:hypothetical protein
MMMDFQVKAKNYFVSSGGKLTHSQYPNNPMLSEPRQEPQGEQTWEPQGP